MLTAELVRERALELGFDLIGFAPVGKQADATRFEDWLSAGYHGEMAYLAREEAVGKRRDPRRILSSARTVIMVGMSYETLAVPHEVLRDPSRGRIARYAWGADYHDVMTPVLRAFGEWVGRESRAYVDTGPVLERSWAEQCGLGFIGKNTCLIQPRGGSFLFLGAVLVNEELRIENEELRKHNDVQSPFSTLPSQVPKCGACTRCLTACPTGALPEPGVLDARKCISYLTIELKGNIPIKLRPLMGNWVFGCDVCQDVCPYVRQFSRPTTSVLGKSLFPVDVDRAAPKLIDVLSLDRAGFHERYGRTPLARTKRRGLLRNACVAAGNWRSPDTLPILERLCADEEPVVREHAQWAIDVITSSVFGVIRE